MRKLWITITAIGWLFIMPFGQVLSAAESTGGFNIALIHKPDSLLHKQTIDRITTEINQSLTEQVTYFNLFNDNSQKLNSIKHIDLAISIGSESARQIIASKPDYPVLFTLIPRQTLDALLHERDSHNQRFYAIYLDQPARRILQLSRIILGKPARLGIVLDSADNPLTREVKSASTPTDRLVLRYATDYSKPIDAMNETLDESDIYLAMYDANLLNRHTAKWLLYMAYKKNKPIIGYSQAYTNAGAVTSIYSTPEQIGRQTGEMAVKILSGKTIKHYLYPEYFTITVNKRIQRLLKLKPKTPSEIKSELLSVENGESYD